MPKTRQAAISAYLKAMEDLLLTEDFKYMTPDHLEVIGQSLVEAAKIRRQEYLDQIKD